MPRADDAVLRVPEVRRRLRDRCPTEREAGVRSRRGPAQARERRIVRAERPGRLSDSGPIEPRPEPRRGPLVRRAVHRGAALWIVGTLLFLAAMSFTQLTWTEPYSLTTNTISDLGNTQCGPWPTNTSHVVCSPNHLVFDVAIVVFGVLFALGVPLVRSAFPSRRSSMVGLGLAVVAGAGAIGVGLFPENVNLAAHTVSAGLAFVAGNLAVLVFALAMFRDTRWDGYRGYSAISGLVGLVAVVLFRTGAYGPLGPGGMERLVVAPLLLWLLLASIHLLSIPTFAPKTIAPSSGA